MFSFCHSCQDIVHTGKSSCVTVGGIPPAAYPVRGMCCPGEGEAGGVAPVLVLARGRGRGGVPSILVLAGGRGVRGGVPYVPSLPLPPSGQDQDRGTPFPPLHLERTWDQRLGKEPGTRGHGIPPCPLVTNKLKTLSSLVLHTRAVIMIRSLN